MIPSGSVVDVSASVVASIIIVLSRFINFHGRIIVIVCFTGVVKIPGWVL